MDRVGAAQGAKPQMITYRVRFVRVASSRRGGSDTTLILRPSSSSSRYLSVAEIRNAMHASVPCAT